MATQCGQCLNLYDQQENIPRICNTCGHSLCQNCLTRISLRESSYKCPYCKNSTKALWTKNQSLINLIGSSANQNRCQPHNRKAISLCCSPNCIVSPSICDLAQCSKLHKQKGTNNLPLSFFFQTPDTPKSSMDQTIIQDLLLQTRKVVQKILNEEKRNFLNRCLQKQTMAGFRYETQALMNQIKQNKFSGVSSKKLYQIKTQMIILQQQQETQMMTRYFQLIEDQKNSIINAIISAINNIEINLLENMQKKSKQNNVSIKIQTPQFMTQKFSCNIKLKQNNLKTESQAKIMVKSQNQYYEDAIKLCFQPKAHLQYELIRQVIGRDFNIRLLFSAAKDQSSYFKQKIAGQNNLFTRIQLADGKIIGSFFKQSYPVSFGQDLFITDSSAFIYWLNQFRVYKAAKGSIAQYDISPDYLFSCGSTYNWDGFWFRKNFSQINPQLPSNTKQIKSKQYVDLNIPIPDKRVIRFECYQIQFK